MTEKIATFIVCLFTYWCGVFVERHCEKQRRRIAAKNGQEALRSAAATFYSTFGERPGGCVCKHSAVHHMDVGPPFSCVSCDCTGYEPRDVSL